MGTSARAWPCCTAPSCSGRAGNGSSIIILLVMYMLNPLKISGTALNIGGSETGSGVSPLPPACIAAAASIRKKTPRIVSATKNQPAAPAFGPEAWLFARKTTAPSSMNGGGAEDAWFNARRRWGENGTRTSALEAVPRVCYKIKKALQTVTPNCAKEREGLKK